MVTAVILKIMSVLPIIISVSNLMGIQILIPFGYKKEFSKVLMVAGGLSLVIIYPAINLYAEYGAAILVVVTELIVTMMMVYTVIKLKILKVSK